MQTELPTLKQFVSFAQEGQSEQKVSSGINQRSKGFEPLMHEHPLLSKQAITQ